MKKIFKALALILALTLVIGAIPVSAAESTTGLSLKSKKRSLYIDGSKGLKEDGTQCKAGAEYKVTKLIKGYDSKTMTVALKSSKPAVVSTKGKKIIAESLGKATVTISVKSKTGTILDTLKLKVKVKKNAKDIVAYVTDVDGNLIAPGDKLGLNTPYVVTLTRKDAATGKQVDTDYRSLTCSDDSVTIKPVNSYTTQYAVTFSKMGKFTFTAGAYQSKVYPKAHTTAELEVVAGYTAVAAEQSALDAVKVTFDTKVAGLDKSLFKVYYKVKDAKISAGDIKDVNGIVYGEDGNTVEVNFLRNFFGGREYFVEFNGEVVGSFTAITVNQDSPKQVILVTETVQAGVKTFVDYKILDENGIDIKNEVGSANKLCKGTIKFETSNKQGQGTASVSPTKGEILISNIGTSVDLKVTVDWRDSKNTPCKIEDKKTVTAIDPIMPVLGEIKSTMTKNEAGAKPILKVVNAQQRLQDVVNSWEGGWIGEFTMTEASTKNASGSAVAVVGLQVAIPYTDRYGNVFYDYIGKTYGDSEKVNRLYKKYVAVSSDPGIVMIGDDKTAALKYDDTNDDLIIPLVANQVGEASIIIYGVPFDKKAPKEVVGIVGVSVEPKRVATDLVVGFADEDKKNLNIGWADDACNLNFAIMDQYGREILGQHFTVEKTKDTTGPSLKSDKYYMTTNQWGSELRLTPGYIKASTVKADDPVLSLTVTNTETKWTDVIDLYVGNETKTSYQQLKLTYGTKVDSGKVSSFNTNITPDVADVSWGTLHTNILLEGVTENSYAVSGAPITFSEKEPEWIDLTVAGTVKPAWATKIDAKSYVYTISKDGKTLSKDDINKKQIGTNTYAYPKLWDTAANVLYGVQGTAVTGGAMYKLDAGTYTITAWELTYDGKAITYSDIDEKTITVNDNQLLPTFRKTDYAEKLTNFEKASLDKAFVVDFGDYEKVKRQDYKVSYTYQAEGEECFIASITVTFKCPKFYGINTNGDKDANGNDILDQNDDAPVFSVSSYPNTVLRTTDSQ